MLAIQLYLSEVRFNSTALWTNPTGASKALTKLIIGGGALNICLAANIVNHTAWIAWIACLDGTFGGHSVHASEHWCIYRNTVNR